MIPAELEKLIIRHRSEGHLPFFVNCTTGTTVYGAFDPIEPIADICEKYGIWLHIDVRLNPSSPLSLPNCQLIAGCMGRWTLDELSLQKRPIQRDPQVLDAILFDFPLSCTKWRAIYFCRADSVTWNPHKLMGTLLQCSTLHVKENVSCRLPLDK